ncbi:MAG: ComF family protein [Sedimentisphaerales bacterium]|nr:ComF family protein [Sedimentisphaerales bacterium]
MISVNGGNLYRRFRDASAQLMQSVHYLLWPGVCDCCGEPVEEEEGGLCRPCWQGLLESTAGDYCPTCGRDASRYGLVEERCGQCQGLTLEVDGIARAGVYGPTLRELILAMKFRDRPELARRLCPLLDAALQAAEFAGRIEFFVPVPLHWRRRLMRGFNQSHLLCKGLRSHAAPVNTDLVRIRYTERQWNLTPAGRKRNVKGAFAVRRGHDFSGKTVCLVDDITTSGATLSECARTLKEVGAARVYALVAAVAMQDLA